MEVKKVGTEVKKLGGKPLEIWEFSVRFPSVEKSNALKYKKIF